MNPYLKNLNKIEFVVTEACTGHCKHCSQGAHAARGARLDADVAADAVKSIAAAYEIKTVMAFGGEPLLHMAAVSAVMQTATALHIPRRQVITNGYFAKDAVTVRAVAARLAACGVNDLLLSVDAFHQETIPLDTVRLFAKEAQKCGIPLRLSPAWLVSRTHDDPYNQKTREILASLADLGIPVSEGNVVFPEGNALQYLAAYFIDGAPKNPYAEDPCDVRTVSVGANGAVLGGNIYQRDIMEILKEYTPLHDQ